MTAPTVGLEAAYNHELKALDTIRHDAHRRGQLAHYETMAEAASVPCLLALLMESRAALGPQWTDLAGRIDDALGRRS